MKQNDEVVPLRILTQSPFFEPLPKEFLTTLADTAEIRQFHQGELLLEQGHPADFLMVLASGSVRLSFHSDDPSGNSPQVKRELRRVTEVGRVIGWSALVPPYTYHAHAEAIEHTTVLCLPKTQLDHFIESDPRLGRQILERVLWQVGNRLRDARTRYIVVRYNEEILSIQTLIKQSEAQLSVSSPLHKIPYYLEHRLTLDDAFDVLELLTVHGDEIERSLASLCLQILEKMRGELEIFHGLQRIYEHVSGASKTETPPQVRKACCEEFVQLFKTTDYIIKGQENLPKDPGHIFFMNHLENHPDNMLPNHFRLTLDTHFVSAMIIYRAYGIAPIRVIRKPHADEYGHEFYYRRLGYIYVTTDFVDAYGPESHETRDERRKNFLQEGARTLADGVSVVICPEGRCLMTEDSPTTMKPGAFRLAAYARPEPLLVPITVANFEKKISRVRLGAVIFPPFRLSEHVENLDDMKEILSFINSYQARFSDMVEEVRQLVCD